MWPSAGVHLKRCRSSNADARRTCCYLGNVPGTGLEFMIKITPTFMAG